MNNSIEVPPPGSPSAPEAGSAEIEHAIEELTQQRQQLLSELIAESRRCGELAAALEGDPAQQLHDRRDALNQAILSLLDGWLSLGGSIQLGAPLAAAGAPTAAPKPAQPHGAHAQAIPSGQAREPAEGRFVPPSPSARNAPVEPRADQALAEGWDEDLAELLLDLACSSNAHEEMSAVQRAANASFSRWASYPRAVQRALVGNLACRLRHLQDHLEVTGPKLDSAFRSLTRFSKSYQPGWVNGLTRGRGPAADSWAEEARVWWDQLAMSAQCEQPTDRRIPDSGLPDRDEALDSVRGWLEEWRQAPDVAKPMCLDKTLTSIKVALDAGVPHTDPELCRLADEIYDHLELARFRRLRQGIRDLELVEREEQGLAPLEPVPSDWPWWSHTVGRRALLLAAEPDQQRLELIEASFGLAGLRHREPGASDEEILELLSTGGTDIVLVVGSSTDEPAVRSVIRGCQVQGLPWVHVEQRLGVTRVRMAIERFLQPDPRAEEPGT